MRIVWRILKISGIVLVSLVLVLAGIVYFLSDKIEAYAIAEINKQLAVQVKVETHDVTLFETFPNISVKFTGVVIPESTPLAGKPMLEAKKIYLAFNLIDVLSGRYKISKIRVDDAVARIYIKDANTNNFSILKQDTAATAGSTSALDLKNILLLNTRIDYTDLSERNKIDITLAEIKASGNFSESRFKLHTSGEGNINRLKFGKSEWFEGKPFSLECGIDVNSGNNTYLFEETRLELAEAVFLLKGNITRPDKNYVLNLDVEGHETNIGTFLAILPKTYADDVKQYTSEGQFYFKTKISGETGDGKTPLIDMAFGIHNGTIINHSFGGNFSNVNLSATLNNKNGVYTLSVDPFSGILNKHSISGRIMIRDFANPYIDTRIKGSLDLKDLAVFLGLNQTEMNGLCSADVSLAGLVSDMQSASTLMNTRFSGSVKLNETGIHHTGSPFRFSHISGTFNFTNQTISGQDVSGHIGNNPFRFTGSVDNLLPYFFREGERIRLSGSLFMPDLSLDEFLNNNGNGGKGADTSVFKFPQVIDLSLNAAFNRFRINKFSAEKMIAELSLSNNTLRITELSAHTMDGDVVVNGSVKNMPNGEFLARLNFDGKGLDITKLFYQCGNFSQEELTDKNISGKLTTNFQMAAYLSNRLVMDLNRTYIFADILVENGQLKNYKPLEGLSKFASVEELRNVSFKTLHNQIEIKDNSIVIPTMMVSNSVMDIQVSGSHTFENYMAYSLKLKVSDILAAKYNWRKNRKADEVEDLGKQGMAIYLTIKGTPDNLQYGITKIGFKPKLNITPPQVAETVKQEKHELKQLLKEEFSRKPEDKKTPVKEETVEWEE